MKATCERDRMKHLDKRVRQQGNEYMWEEGEHMLERNEGRVIDWECCHEESMKVCTSMGELVQHQKLKHQATPGEGKVRVLELWFRMRDVGGVFES